MNSQKLEQEVIQRAEQTASIATESVENGLRLLLQRLPDYFRGRAERDDIETLVFCLHRLYNCIDTLYQHTLPALTHLTIQRHANTFAHRHALWEQLQAIFLLLERIESHCHLLLGTTTCILATLDTTEDAVFSTEAATAFIGTEQWQHAYEVLSLALHGWQEQHKAHLAFATVFASLPISSLISIDTAFALLFDSANAIFGDIIPDIQLVAQGDDEVVAMLLFDLMQQNDLFLIQISKLVEPLQQLMKYYAVTE